jgi:drug/metabolite transporter (DMT)-like permease
VGATAFAIPAALTWDLDGAAVPYVIASGLLELAYFALLAAAYGRADYTFVYPIARGCAPVLVLAVSVAALDAHVSVIAAAGVVLVAGGVLLVRGVGRGGDPAALGLALGVAATIASYTLVDAHGVRHASPIPYFECVLVICAVPYALAQRRGVRAALDRRSLPAGLGMVGAYVLVLAALERADAAPVAAVRETSVVMAAAGAALAGRERVPPGRVAGAAAVVAGIAAIALG